MKKVLNFFLMSFTVLFFLRLLNFKSIFNAFNTYEEIPYDFEDDENNDLEMNHNIIEKLDYEDE